MATSLYDLSVPTFLQTLRGVAGCLGRAVTHCARIGSDPDDFVNARLIADMAPFHFQIEALANHSVGGLETVKTGVFAPARLVGMVPFARLRTRVDEAIGALEALSPDEVNGWAGKVLDIAIYRPSDDEDLVSPRAPRQMAFTSLPPMTSCARGAYRSASALIRADYLRSARDFGGESPTIR